jgi:hypothetical protein
MNNKHFLKIAALQEVTNSCVAIEGHNPGGFSSYQETILLS